MDKEELFKVLNDFEGTHDIHINHLHQLTTELFNAMHPVGGHHDHMCPCGRDWETDIKKFKRLLREYREKYVWSIPEGEIERICDWLDEEKING